MAERPTPNSARFIFLNPKAREFFAGWERAADDVNLTYEAFELAADSGLRINVYTAAPGSPSEEALKVLASWAATQRERTEAAVKETK